MMARRDDSSRLDHVENPGRLPCNVHIVHAMLYTRFYHWCPIPHKWSDSANHDVSACRGERSLAEEARK
jgi:hypothetical protein